MANTLLIEIVESEEALVDLLEAVPGIKIQLEPGRVGENTAYARKTIAEKLRTAQDLLPKGVVFVINDAWRPRVAQERYFNYYLDKVSKAQPDWSHEKAYREAAKFAIPPTEIYRAGHMTGAAIDVQLMRNGRRLPMQSRSLNFAQRATTDSPQLQPYIDRNRQLLLDVMTKVGLVNYPREYWHFSYGDVMWAEYTGSSRAIYGVIEKTP